MSVYIFGTTGILFTLFAVFWESYHNPSHKLVSIGISVTFLSMGAITDLICNYTEFIPYMFWFKISFGIFLVVQFVKMIAVVKNYITESTRLSVLKELAYKDAMTDVWNRTAYLDKKNQIEEKWKNNRELVILVFDINNLKKINDSLGHERGYHLIRDGADVIKKIYGTQSVYRIGGDEFVVLLEGIDYKKRFEKLQQFADYSKETNLEIAYGMAATSGNFGTYDSMFQKSDEAMYETKKRMKVEEIF